MALKMKLKLKKLPPIGITEKHREWLESEKNLKGVSFASSIRRLIQEEVETKEINKEKQDLKGT